MKHKRVILGIGLALVMLINCLFFALPAFAADETPQVLTKDSGTYYVDSNSNEYRNLYGNYILTGDVKLEDYGFGVRGGKTLTIDLNGYVLEGTGNHPVITNIEKGTIKIIDSRPDAGGRWFLIKTNGPWEMQAKDFTPANEDIANYRFIKGGIITGGYYSSTSTQGGGAIRMKSGDSKGVTKLILEAGTIVGNYSARAGGGVYGGAATMKGGAVFGNFARLFGGGLSLSGRLDMEGGIVELNNTLLGSKYNKPESAVNGQFYDFAQVIIGYNTQFTMTGGTIRGNVSTTYETHATAPPNFTFAGGEIVGNFRIQNELTATFSNGTLNGHLYMLKGTCIVTDTVHIFGGNRDEGGSVQILNGSFTMEGGVIENSHSDVSGGAIYLGGGECTISGGIIRDCSATNGGAIYIENGTCSISDAAQIENCTATQNGGAIYMGGGSLTMKGGTVSQNVAQNGAGAYLKAGTMTVSGGEIKNNDAEKDGGAAYLEGGSFVMLGGTISGNTAQNGAGAFVADGNVTVEGGLIENNTAAQNGGAFSISNGGYTMTGGTLNGNRATSGNGGAIYISSSEDTTVTVRSGSITNNFAGTSGGALAVVGQAEVTLTITIGSNTDHTGRVDCHAKTEGNADEACPIIKENNSLTSGGGIYLAGSYTAKMNMYCLVEENNTAGNGVSTSNFMKIEGGTLNISTNEGGTNNGNIKIDSTIHVTGGRVSISGSADNTNFVKAITVEVKEAKDFVDNRQGGKFRTVLYFENAPGGSGKYQLIDYESSGPHTVRANEFNIPGYNMVGWERRVWDASLQDYVDANDRIYNAEDHCTVGGNLVFFAKWEIITYVIKFSPNSTSYDGKMDDLGFNLDEPQTLTLNQYIVIGQMFVEWEWIGAPEGYLNTFADGAEFTWPTDTITEITLVAKWKLCDHKNLEKYSVTTTASSATRKCQCQTFTESISITGINGVYNKGVHEVIPTYSAISSNGADAQPIWENKQNAVQYSGKSNAGQEPNGAPIDAGNYKAFIILDETHTLEVTVFIDRAERTEFPAEPQYDVTVNNNNTDDTSDDVNVIKIKAPNDSTGLILEYLFSWYENDVLCTSNDDNHGWDPWNAENPPTQELSVLYTNYYVEVRYAEDYNYKASQSTVGTKVIFFEGNVVFAIRSKDNALTYTRVDPQENEGKKEGILVTLVPKSDSYYIYNILKEMTAIYTSTGDEVADYQLPAMSVEKANSDEWVIRIYEVKDSTEPITINVDFLGTAEKKVIIDSSVARDEVFTDIEKGEADVAISNDSAYTVRFNVENYKHYQSLAITFGEALPIGTTIIMKDIANSSYWSYTVSLEGITSVSLDKFFRMGTRDQSFAIGGEAFTLQFAIDFSNCENALPIDTILATSLTAESVTPDAGSIEILSGVALETIGKNIPTFTAKKDITIVGAPNFSLAPSDTTSQSQLSQALSYQFAYTKEASAGVSKWSGISGILVVTPTVSSILPPDARLEVKIGNSTDIYPLVNGCFMVALPAVGGETATLTLLSDMLPNETKTYGFTVCLYASATMVKTTPATALSSEIEVAYQTVATVIPTISVKIKDGVLPKYENESITPLEFEGVLKNVPNGCTVRALLYRKNEYGRYAYTLTSLSGGDNGNNGSFYIEEGTGKFEGVLQLTSFAEGMKIAEGSLSLRLDIEVVDPTGKVINSVPMYFILIDTRQ